MKKTLIIISISSALVAGFFFGKNQRTSVAKPQSNKSKILPLLEQLKNNPSKELYERVFLLLLAEIGFNSFKIDLPTVEKIVEKEVEIIKDKECPTPTPTQVENQTKNKNKTKNRKQLKKDPIFYFNKNISKVYKNSYVLTSPFKHKIKHLSFDVMRKGYDSDNYAFQIKTDLKHNGKYWSGNISALLESENNGTIDKLEEKGVNTKILLAPTKPESLFIDMKKFLVQLTYNQGRLQSGFIFMRRGKSLIPWASLRETFIRE